MWVYKTQKESDGHGNHLRTVGFYDPQGVFQTDSDHTDDESARARVHFLNGGKPEPTVTVAFTESRGADRIAIERGRQISEEEFTREHDAEHDEGEILRAAICYALDVVEKTGLFPIGLEVDHFVDRLWPFEGHWWKPDGGRIRKLEKAGALIAAEIDRLLDAGETSETE